MIKLFESQFTVFDTQGIGSLISATSCIITEELNGSYELEMEYPIFGNHYSKLLLRSLIVSNTTPEGNPQPFRVYSISKPINGIVTVNAAHISYDLSDIPVDSFKATSANSAFIQLKNKALIDCPFTFVTNVTNKGTINVEDPRSIRSVMGNNIRKAFEGEYEFDNFVVYHKTNRGVNRGVSIRYGKNLLDIRQEENCSEMYTGIYPYWSSSEDGLVTLPEKIIDFEGTFNFRKIFLYDLSDQYTSEAPTEEQIRENVANYIEKKKMGVPKISIDVSFIQLSRSTEYQDFTGIETVRLGDTLNVEFMEANINATAKCIKTVFNALTNSYDSLELGDAESNLAAGISGIVETVTDKVENSYIRFDHEIGSLKVVIADIEQAVIEKADINYLEANFAKIVNGYIDNAIIKDASIETAKIGDAAITTAKIGDAQITSAKIGSAQIETAHIKALNASVIVSESITTDKIQAGAITGDKMTITDGFIKDAMIDTVNARKINSGEINTNNVTIVSESGAMQISDNTMQFKDKNKNVRLQLGEDATGDFSFVLKGVDGTGVIIDQNGITKDAIADGLIKNEMIGAGEIGGDKIDIDSMVTEVNKDTNTTTIKGSKIFIDSLKQTLEVSFKELSTTVAENVETVNSAMTEINVMSGKIAALIQDTTIVTDGESIKLKDAFASLNMTVTGIETIVGRHESSISDMDSAITNVETRITQAEDAISLKASSTEVTEAIRKTVSKIDVMYALSDSTTVAPTTGWSTKAPEWTEGKYMWSKTVTTYVSGAITETAVTCISGSSGSNGLGVSSIKEQYYLSTSNTVQNGGSWVNSAPTWVDGKFMWTRSVITYTDETTTTTDPICVTGPKGATGAQGIQGPPGDNGVGINSVDVEYYLSTSNTTQTGGSWSTTAPTWVDGKYIWSRTKTVNTLNETTYSTPACITGGKGANGTAGRGVSSITEQFYLSTSKTTTTGGSWVETPPTWSTGLYMWTRSKITYINPNGTEYTTPMCDNSWEAVNELDGTIDEMQSNISTTITKMAEIETNVNGISLKADKTETKVTELNGKVVDVETRVSSAEQSITPDAIITTVENGSTKFADKTALEQTAKDFKFKFNEMTGENLLYNTSYKNGMSNWTKATYNNVGNPGVIDMRINNTDWTAYRDCMELVVTGTLTGGWIGVYQDIDTIVGHKYTVSCLMAGHRSTGGISVSGTGGSGGVGSKNYDVTKTGGTNIENWDNLTFSFVATATKQRVYILLRTSEVNGYVWCRDLIITKGETVPAWTPNPNEIVNKSTVINDGGVTVYDGSFTVVNKSGEQVIKGDSNGNVLATRFSIIRPDGAVWVENGQAKFDFNAEACEPTAMHPSVGIFQGFWMSYGSERPGEFLRCQSYTVKHVGRYLKFMFLRGLLNTNGGGNVLITRAGVGDLANRYFSNLITDTANYGETVTVDLGTPTYGMITIDVSLRVSSSSNNAYLRKIRMWMEG